MLCTTSKNSELCNELEILKKKYKDLEKELANERSEMTQTIASSMSDFRRRLPKCCVCHEDVVELRDDTNNRNLMVMNCGHWACKICLEINLLMSPDCPLCKSLVTRTRILFI